MAAEQKDHQQTIDVAKRNWQAEVETAQTYRDLAQRERDEKRQGILLRMAEAEERHAQRWEAKLKELGAEVPVYRDTIGRRLNRWWNKIAGAEIAIRRMEATEERQEAEFHDQAERAFAGEQDVQEFLRKSAIEENPEEEIEKMSLFYQLQGFTPEESQKMAERLAQQPEQFVQAMAQSELGLSEHRFPNQWTAALSAGISTAIGAFVPIIPFFFSGGLDAVIASFGISLVAHFAIGALKSLITMRSWWASGLEMTWIGIIVAVVTYGLGLAFGALG